MTEPTKILRLLAKRPVAFKFGELPRGAMTAWLESKPYNPDDFVDVTGMDDEAFSATVAELFPDLFTPED